MKAPSPRDAASRTALEHEVRDDAVELGALVVERLAGFTDTLLARAERAEVLDGLGHDVAVEAHHHSSGRGAADGDVEEDLRASRMCCARLAAARRASIDSCSFAICLWRVGRSGQLEGHGCSGAGSRALLVTLGSAAATAARSAAENARRAMIVQLLSESVPQKKLERPEAASVDVR